MTIQSGGTSFSRRAVLGGLLLAPLAARGAPQPNATVPQVLARDVRNGWGICGRPGIDAPVEAFGNMMSQIGTRDIRTHINQFGATATEHFQALGRAMQKVGPTDHSSPRVTALVTAYLNEKTTWDEQQPQLLAFAKSGMLRAIEGPNEINNRVGMGAHGPNERVDRTGVSEYASNYLVWAKTIDAFVKSNSSTFRNVLVVAPSIASGRIWDYSRLPDVSAFVDAGNMHFYAGGGRQPSYSMGGNPVVGYFDNLRRWAKAAQAPDKPIWLTECGATTSGNYARDGVSQAKYIANQIFDYFVSGGQRMFIYQLIDGNGHAGDIEGNFGLFYHDQTPKPAAIMLARLQHILSLGKYDDPRNLTDTGRFVPGYNTQALVVTGLTNVGQAGPGYLVMPKSDGSTIIALWNEPVIDDGKGQSVTPPDNRVTVDFGSAQTYIVHDLLASELSANATERHTDRMAAINLRGYPILIELLPSIR